MTITRKRDHIKFLQNMADYHNARKTSKGYRQLHKEEWDKYCKHWDLSEEFIERFHDKVNWDFICRYQILSEDFIKTHINRVDIDIILETQDVSDNFREYLLNV